MKRLISLAGLVSARDQSKAGCCEVFEFTVNMAKYTCTYDKSIPGTFTYSCPGACDPPGNTLCTLLGIRDKSVAFDTQWEISDSMFKPFFVLPDNNKICPEMSGWKQLGGMKHDLKTTCTKSFVETGADYF